MLFIFKKKNHLFKYRIIILYLFSLFLFLLCCYFYFHFYFYSFCWAQGPLGLFLFWPNARPDLAHEHRPNTRLACWPTLLHQPNACYHEGLAPSLLAASPPAMACLCRTRPNSPRFLLHRTIEPLDPPAPSIRNSHTRDTLACHPLSACFRPTIARLQLVFPMHQLPTARPWHLHTPPS